MAMRRSRQGTAMRMMPRGLPEEEKFARRFLRAKRQAPRSGIRREPLGLANQCEQVIGPDEHDVRIRGVMLLYGKERRRVDDRLVQVSLHGDEQRPGLVPSLKLGVDSGFEFGLRRPV